MLNKECIKKDDWKNRVILGGGGGYRSLQKFKVCVKKCHSKSKSTVSKGVFEWGGV